MAETFDQQLARLREIATNSHRFGGCAPDDFFSETDADALAELLRRWDTLTKAVEWAGKSVCDPPVIGPYGALEHIISTYADGH